MGGGHLRVVLPRVVVLAAEVVAVVAALVPAGSAWAVAAHAVWAEVLAAQAASIR